MKFQVGEGLLAFWLMLSCAFAQDSPSDPSAITSVAAQEWRAYVDPLAPIGERTVALMSNPEDPQLRQEAYSLLFMSLSAAYMGLLHADAEHPDFWPIFNQAYNFWTPNPDDVYYSTPVDGNGIYKISGYRGTVRIVDFGISGGTLVTRGSGGFDAVYANYDLDKLHINKKDGSFEVILSAERPEGYKGDWWKLDHKSTYLLVRQIAYDWLHEVDGRFAIERLDRPAIKPRPSAEKIAADLRQVAAWTENWTRMALQWPQNYRAKGLVNKVVVRDLNSIGGLSTQKYIEGLFEIGVDEALIYETEVPTQCRYWGIELNDMRWSAIDITNRQSNLNGYTARLDKDGKFRAVIAATDPGVPNWLDSAGYASGVMFGRWTECSSSPTPTVTKVKLADVRHYLPADTPMVTAEARDAAIRLRRKGAQLRRRW